MSQPILSRPSIGKTMEIASALCLHSVGSQVQGGSRIEAFYVSSVHSGAFLETRERGPFERSSKQAAHAVSCLPGGGVIID